MVSARFIVIAATGLMCGAGAIGFGLLYDQPLWLIGLMTLGGIPLGCLGAAMNWNETDRQLEERRTRPATMKIDRSTGVFVAIVLATILLTMFLVHGTLAWAVIVVLGAGATLFHWLREFVKSRRKP